MVLVWIWAGAALLFISLPVSLQIPATWGLRQKRKMHIMWVHIFNTGLEGPELEYVNQEDKAKQLTLGARRGASNKAHMNGWAWKWWLRYYEESESGRGWAPEDFFFTKGLKGRNQKFNRQKYKGPEGSELFPPAESATLRLLLGDPEEVSPTPELLHDANTVMYCKEVLFDCTHQYASICTAQHSSNCATVLSRPIWPQLASWEALVNTPRTDLAGALIWLEQTNKN